MMLNMGLSHVAFTMLRYIPSIHNFLTAFIIKWYLIFLKAFYASIEMIRGFLSLFLLMCCITFIDLCMLNNSASLGWSWLGLGVLSFWCVVGFELPLYYWGFLHWYSLRKLAYSSPVWRCLCLVLGWE
jgi:hypothetical protein